MRLDPASNLSMAILVSVALMIGGGWLASSLSPTLSQSRTDALSNSLAAPAHPGLRVVLQGVRSDRGNIVVTIYDNAESLASYSSESYVSYQSFAATPGSMTFDFEDLTAGPYAVTVHHDENANWAYDDEGWATSGQRGAFDESPFERAAVMPGWISMDIFYYD